MKVLIFEVKRNLKRPPRIYVKSADLKKTYGAFSADNPSQFSGWDELNEQQKAELKHYMQNLTAVSKFLGEKFLNEQTDYRLRLPISFVEALNEISIICDKAEVELDIFEPILATAIQQLKTSVTKLKGDQKTKVITILDKLNLMEYKKVDYTSQIRAIFSELLGIHNKSEKLR
jgi:hypothetical protein